jgi:large subunit ribosomal protein L25
VPGVIYGNGNEPTTLTLQPRQMVSVLDGPLGRNSIVDLNVDGATRMAIVKDYQVHPWKRKLLHVDLLEITEKTPLTLTVPFKRTGLAPAEKVGARVEIHRDFVTIRCIASTIPAAVEYDMALIEGEYAEVSISEVPMPEGVEALYRKDYKLLRLRIPSAAELAAELAAEEAEAGGPAEDEEGEEGEEGAEEGAEEATDGATAEASEE